MKHLLELRRMPFVVAAAITVIVTVAVFRLPDSLIAQLENSETFSISQRGWAFRLLALAAALQALYVGFAIFRSERVKHARESDTRIASLTHERLMRSLARNAAGVIVLTLLYGLAAVAATGYQTGFWFFVFIAFAQGAWYYRQTGEIAGWLSFQPELVVLDLTGPWVAAPPDYCPPLARALTPIRIEESATE